MKYEDLVVHQVTLALRIKVEWFIEHKHLANQKWSQVTERNEQLPIIDF